MHKKLHLTKIFIATTKYLLPNIRESFTDFAGNGQIFVGGAPEVYKSHLIKFTDMPKNNIRSCYTPRLYSPLAANKKLSLCPSSDYPVGIVSFPRATNNAYLTNSRLKLKFEVFILTVRFKVWRNNSDGLILVMSEIPDASPRVIGFAIYLKGGKVHIRSKMNQKVNILNSEITVNDREWHFITIRKDLTKLSIYLDHNLLQELKPTKSMPVFLLGGVKSRVQYEDLIEESIKSFTGCFADFTYYER